MNRAAKARLQLRAVAVLRALKQSRTYDELAAETELPAGDLNRYVNGHVLPSVERARAVVEGTGREAVVAELEDRIRLDEEGYVDNSRVVFDQSFLDILATVVAADFDDPAPDAVLTAATDGITFGAALASHLGARVAYAKKSRETAVEEFVEARDRVVDDLVRSGETQTLLLDIAERAGATVVGVAALIAAGDEGLSRARARVDAPVAALVGTE